LREGRQEKKVKVKSEDEKDEGNTFGVEKVKYGEPLFRGQLDSLL